MRNPSHLAPPYRSLLPASQAAAAAAIRPQRRTFTDTSRRRGLSKPLNIPKWLEANSHLLKPPINNYCVTNDDMTVMIVGGPNARTDYHINSTPELFYQYRGSMLLKTVQPPSSPSSPPTFHDIPIAESELYLLPPNIPHNPIRYANTVGIVVEQPRPADSVDRLRWYCRGCGDVVHEAAFHMRDLGSQIREAVEAFAGDRGLRTCGGCGEVCDVTPRAS
ncbi:3-HAO-domain-containing protein [Patellaria atrata CBS 101060]|uniref:3-hydroxyanthranilate 3,4-dioxygenase n=1 Tax=Patellaria atrata CBS 101060 TaxID=1346257 RepID=A0A9P4S508_9PEZI|nr:3-HAO-domain-containing protein [Patellaria atrata CBS 101060]